MQAKINEVWHPVEVIRLFERYGMRAVRVRAVDGTKPFATCRWSAPFVYSEEGNVTLKNLRVS